MTCEKDHSGDLPRGPIIALEESQAGFWRHKCAGCAYEMGKRDAGDTADCPCQVSSLTLDRGTLCERGLRLVSGDCCRCSGAWRSPASPGPVFFERLSRRPWRFENLMGSETPPKKWVLASSAHSRSRR